MKLKQQATMESIKEFIEFELSAAEKIMVDMATAGARKSEEMKGLNKNTKKYKELQSEYEKYKRIHSEEKGKKDLLKTMLRNYNF